MPGDNPPGEDVMGASRTRDDSVRPQNAEDLCRRVEFAAAPSTAKSPSPAGWVAVGARPCSTSGAWAARTSARWGRRRSSGRCGSSAPTASRGLVFDEAHNVCPAAHRSDVEAVAADLVVRIAAEGRKYGLYLALSTQEPHKVHPEALSQCAKLMLLRTTSTTALTHLASVFSDVPPGLLQPAPRFRLGQGLVAGRIAPHAMTFQTGPRLTHDGGRDVPADWVRPGAPS